MPRPCSEYLRPLYRCASHAYGPGGCPPCLLQFASCLFRSPFPHSPGDSIADTVFGRLDTACEPLDPSRYRNHGSLYERDIPLIAYQADGLLPETGGIRYNLDLTRRLFR